MINGVRATKGSQKGSMMQASGPVGSRKGSGAGVGPTLLPTKAKLGGYRTAQVSAYASKNNSNNSSVVRGAPNGAK